MQMDNIIATRPHKIIYRDGNTCIKAFDENYSKADILNEALNHARVEQTGLNIPGLLGVNVVDGKWAIMTEFIEGKTLAQLMRENPDKKEEYLSFLVDLQLKMHAMTCPMLNKLKDKMQGKISVSGLDATTRYDLHIHLDSMPTHSKICHGDFNPSNVIVAEDGTMTIVDWSHATQGNASGDAAITYLQFALKNQKLADLYLDLFCKKSDTAKQYVQKWLPIAAAVQLTKGIEEEKAFLSRWIDVIDFQ